MQRQAYLPNTLTEAYSCRCTSRLTTINLAGPTATNSRGWRGTWRRLKRKSAYVCKTNSSSCTLHSLGSYTLRMQIASIGPRKESRGQIESLRGLSLVCACMACRNYVVGGCAEIPLCGRSSKVACPRTLLCSNKFSSIFCGHRQYTQAGWTGEPSKFWLRELRVCLHRGGALE
jgi:hypothetical protein